ncbi:hypothetical protein E2C01_023280 [Portunus trituberculatus]|uniref:Uncharacterized protein n=1 Tax=Portunus trituberculatus TaxID=210409 RepID=A0A5B7E9Z7_PORTR|nr:hypothetical protein [Portunus trituberculatus]
MLSFSNFCLEWHFFDTYSTYARAKDFVTLVQSNARTKQQSSRSILIAKRGSAEHNAGRNRSLRGNPPHTAMSHMKAEVEDKERT